MEVSGKIEYVFICKINVYDFSFSAKNNANKFSCCINKNGIAEIFLSYSSILSDSYNYLIISTALLCLKNFVTYWKMRLVTSVNLTIYIKNEFIYLLSKKLPANVSPIREGFKNLDVMRIKRNIDSIQSRRNRVSTLSALPKPNPLSLLMTLPALTAIPAAQPALYHWVYTLDQNPL